MPAFSERCDLITSPVDGHAYKPKVIWFTGLSGAGKTTLANALQTFFKQKGLPCVNFDGDILRKGINKDLGYSDNDRMENIRRASEIAKLFIAQQTFVICSFITPLESMRFMAEEIISHEKFILVYVNCSLDVCEQRDVKGMYQQARKGSIKDFTGIHSLYEPPIQPDIEINSGQWELQQSISFLTEKVQLLII
ncbi:MAG: adenylyl-sulfate kinase [Bacteroidales bacterium]|jgi:adenylyl-sulfate kinase|nr:adenylyl-sulfate kinase [Bacteroidales bacterium]MDD4214167.1 adenylyl-sulfate kinase [Bacteroidales bacterium]